MKNKKIILLLSLALLAIIGLEFYNLTAMALWHDEAFSALLIKYDFKEMIHRIGLDVHPPFYYLLLRGWNFIFGDSLFSLRAFSVFFGILTVLGIYLLSKEAFGNKKLALFAPVLALLNSFQIQYNMEARMYTLGAFLVVISSYLLLKSLKSKRWLWWFLYALAVSAGIYTHYYVFFWVFAQAVFIVYWLFKESKWYILNWLRNKNFQFSLGAYVIVILSYLPWLKIFLRQINQVKESYWIPPLNIWSVPNTFFNMTTGDPVDPTRFWYFLVFLMGLVIIAVVYFLKKIDNSIKWLIFLLIVIPFLLSILFSLKTSIYLDRYFIFTLPFYLILIGGTVLLIKNKVARNILVMVLILGNLVAFPIRWAKLDVGEKPGMAGVANYLNQEVKPEDKIYVGSSFIYFTFKYYNQTGVPPRLYQPYPLPHFSGTALLSPEDIITDFSQEVKKGNIVWMLNTTGFGNYQPTVPNNWLKKEEKDFQDVYDYRGWIIVTNYQVQ